MKRKIFPILEKKTSWTLLILFFIFDNVVSYWGIKYMNGKEGNILIAPIVEKYPLLYFVCIPLTIIIMYFIVKFLLLISTKIFKRWGFDNKNILERMILSATVVYWAVSNSSMNLAFLLGFRVEISFLIYPAILGISSSLFCFFWLLLHVKKS